MTQLSVEQDAIIKSNHDNILIIACPGSGKTHTIISKYYHLINNKIVKPEEVILITYTKKAGLEMYNRINNLLSDKLPFYVGSLHGFSYKILNNYYKNHTIIDETDIDDLLNIIIESNYQKDILQENNLQIKELKDFMNKLTTSYPVNIKELLKKTRLEKHYLYIKNIYNLYQNKKKKEKILDFNDLMIKLCQFLDDKKIDMGIKYIFFDEFQDINPIQNYILDKLQIINKSKVILVGDDSQSIYSFRGSSIKYILNIDTTKFKIYSLTHNYRSSENIINFYQNIIKNNNNKFNKHFNENKNLTENNKKDHTNELPSVHCFKTKNEQYKWIINDILKKINNGLCYSEISILAKNNFSLNNIELLLIMNKIPITKHIGTLLLNKPHIKIFLSWISILVNINSTIHWQRIFDLNNIDKIINISNIKNYIKKLSKDVINNDNMIDILTEYIKIKNIKDDNEKIKYIIKMLNYNDDNNKDINNLLKYFKNITLEEFINNLYLNYETIEDNKTVYLSTIHGSKGLEWDTVYIIDMDNKISKNSYTKYYLEQFEDIEEERRLLYVGTSRAKKNLIITASIDNYLNPIIKEINKNTYNLILNNNNINKFKPTLTFQTDIKNYFLNSGYLNIYSYLKLLKNNRYYIYNTKLFNFKNNTLINTFLLFFIYKVIYDNFSNQTELHFSEIFQKYFKLNKLCETNFINVITNLFLLSYYEIFEQSLEKLNYNDELDNTQKINNLTEDIKKEYYLLINDKGIINLKIIELNIIKLFKKFNPNNIKINYNIKVYGVSENINILCDNKLINIYLSEYCKKENRRFDCTANIHNITETLLLSYLLKKNNYEIAQNIIFNPLNGEVNDLNIVDIDLLKLKKNIYSINY
uniref:DNA 3'-5' helicase n=1 Tax=viral metagenome TaxID=1070528 RepID=A0A6C0EGW6_9ZZZZ